MVQTIRPTWTLTDQRLARGGYLPVYHHWLDTPTGTRRAVLKASPDGEPHGIDVEARVLRILEAHTAIPVPGVYGAVDDHDDLPAPFYLAEFVPGRTVQRTALDEVSSDTLEGIARASGRYLRELHDLDAVDAYGFLQRAPDTTLRGEQPPVAVDQVEVGDPEPSWPVRLEEWAEAALEGAAESRFADLVPELRPALEARVAAVDGPFRPVLCHVDNSLENVRFDPEMGEITALLDWAFTLAATPAYDLVLVEQSLRGGRWRFVPSTPDRADLVRTALREGYTAAGPTPVTDQLDRNRECYELLSLCRSMHLIESWPDNEDVAAEAETAATEAIRSRAATYL